MDEFMNLVYPLDVLTKNEKMLIEYYVEQYGEDVRSLIEERNNKTIYLLVSPPDVTYNFLLENSQYVIDWEYFEMIEAYYNNFIRKKKYLKEQYEEALSNMFYNIHDISINDYKNRRDEILKLIKNIKDLDAYKSLCLKLGIKCEDDKETFRLFMLEKEKLQRRFNSQLIRKSLWGQDIKDSFFEMGFDFSDEVLSAILDLKSQNVAHCFNFNSFIISYIPIIQIHANGGDVDRVFLHENRHVVESGDFIGIHGIQNLRILNEVRTEMHAKEDEENLPVLFSRKASDNLVYHYENIMLFCEKLMNKYWKFIDRCAIENNLNLLYDAFGEKEINKYGAMINKSYYELLNFFNNGKGYFEVDGTEHLNLESKLIENAIKNGYFPYQKVKSDKRNL